MKNLVLVALFMGAMAFTSCGKEKNCDCWSPAAGETVETTKKECSDLNKPLQWKVCVDAE